MKWIAKRNKQENTHIRRMNVRNYLNRIIFLATELLFKIDNLLKLCKFKFVLKIYEKRKKKTSN